MISEVLFALWFFLPAGVANMAPVLAAVLPGLRRLNAPLDFGVSVRGKRLFGSHKTWRGLVAGSIAAIVVLALQQYAVREYGWFARPAEAVGYTMLPTVALGAIFAIGALAGDAIESFIKRQRGIAPGKAWFPYDVIDHIIGAAILTAPFVLFAWWIYPVVVSVWLFATLAVSYAGHWMRIKERPL